MREECVYSTASHPFTVGDYVKAKSTNYARGVGKVSRVQGGQIDVEWLEDTDAVRADWHYSNLELTLERP